MLVLMRTPGSFAPFSANVLGCANVHLCLLCSSSCTRRQDEIHGHKKVQDLVIDEQGVRLQQSRPDLRVDLPHSFSGQEEEGNLQVSREGRQDFQSTFWLSPGIIMMAELDTVFDNYC